MRHIESSNTKIGREDDARFVGKIVLPAVGTPPTSRTVCEIDGGMQPLLKISPKKVVVRILCAPRESFGGHVAQV